MAEFNTVHIVSLENASRFFSGAPVKICHIPVNFFMTIAKIFHNPSKVSYVDLSSNGDFADGETGTDLEGAGDSVTLGYFSLILFNCW